ncbi:MAG: WYL domain-containing protein [Chitinophagaceae bacterium]|nr:WYL domain-containing protein [Chitinophagaceae bacterium]
MKAVLRSSDKDFVEELDNRIVIRVHPMHMQNDTELHMSLLRQALVEKRAVRMRYYSAYKDEATDRDAEPIGLLYYSMSWHLIAWCRLRNDYRDFRLDRIKQISLLDEVFNDDSHPSLQEYMQQLRSEQELQEIILSFERDIARIITREKYNYGFVSEEEKDGRIHMRFLSAHPDYLCRWLLMFTNGVKIETPEPVAPIVAKLLQELEKTYTHVKMWK